MKCADCGVVVEGGGALCPPCHESLARGELRCTTRTERTGWWEETVTGEALVVDRPLLAGKIHTHPPSP